MLKETKPMIAGIYLAAGKSSRMGSNKLNLPLVDMPLGSFALRSALYSSLDQIFVVTREEDSLEWISPFLISNEKLLSVRCMNASQGQAESLKTGIKAALEMDVDAVIIFLADQPLLSIQMIETIVNH